MHTLEFVALFNLFCDTWYLTLFYGSCMNENSLVSVVIDWLLMKQCNRGVVRTSVCLISELGELCNKKWHRQDFEMLITWSTFCKLEYNIWASDWLLKYVMMVFSVHRKHVEFVLTYPSTADICNLCRLSILIELCNRIMFFINWMLYLNWLTFSMYYGFFVNMCKEFLN